MRKLKQRSDVQCPFYCGDDGQSDIVCEGITENSRCIQRFKRKQDLFQQLDVFCSKNVNNCEVYGMLLSIYEEGEG